MKVYPKKVVSGPLKDYYEAQFTSIPHTDWYKKSLTNLFSSIEFEDSFRLYNLYFKFRDPADEAHFIMAATPHGIEI
jgi:hypothetical protein